MSRLLAVVAELGAVARLAAHIGPLSARSEARLARIRAPRRRSQSVVVRQLAAAAASRLLGRDVPGSDVEDAEHGAGLCLRDAPELRISISHSGERVAVAIGTRAIGIDVERCDDSRDCLALARHACSAAEVAWLERTAPAERAARFYLLWTLREAAFKAGLRAAALGGESCLDPDSAIAGFCWGSREIDGYRVSVATSEPAPLEWLGIDDAGLAPLAMPVRETLGAAGGSGV